MVVAPVRDEHDRRFRRARRQLPGVDVDLGPRVLDAERSVAEPVDVVDVHGHLRQEQEQAADQH